MRILNKAPKCKVCGTDEVVNFYPKNRSKCKGCISIENKKKHAEITPEKKQEKYEYNTQWTIDNIIHSRYMAAKARVANKDLEFTIDELFVYQMMVRQNYTCGLSGIRFDNYCRDYSPSLERIDSRKGYTPENVMWVTTACNYMKNDLPSDKFNLISARVAITSFVEYDQLDLSQNEIDFLARVYENKVLKKVS